MRDVYCIGAGMTKFGRYPDLTIPELACMSVTEAIDDAGMSIRDVNMLICGNHYNAHQMTGERILQSLGQTGIPVMNVANACATGSSALWQAYQAVSSGAFDVAMAVGVEKMGKMGLLPHDNGLDPAYDPEAVLGSQLNPTIFGLLGMEHSRKYGTTVEQFAKVAVKNHEHSKLNPKSQYMMSTPLEDVLNARMIVYPNTLYMCCPTGDGSATAILTSKELALQHTSEPIKVAAAALVSDPWSEHDLTMADFNSTTRLAAKQAYAQAGLGPEDLDCVELHDCFATAELLHYENLGLCADGEAGRMIDEKATYLGGKIPVNTSGGLLSKGHPLGATGVANVYEIMTQLRGRAGARQVEGAKVGLAQVVGLGTAGTVHILTK